MNGPRSLIRTIIDLLPLVKSSFVPNGSVLCAAVNPSGTNLSPDAVRLPCIYQEAFMVFPDTSVDVVAQPPNRSTTSKLVHRIYFPFLNGDQGRTQTLNLRFRRPMLYSVELTDRLEIIQKCCTIALQRVCKQNSVVVRKKLLNNVTKNIIRYNDDPTHVHFLLLWRGRSDSNRHSKVLQTLLLPLQRTSPNFW